jgi:hypothetical protein
MVGRALDSYGTARGLVFCEHCNEHRSGVNSEFDGRVSWEGSAVGCDVFVCNVGLEPLTSAFITRHWVIPSAY